LLLDRFIGFWLAGFKLYLGSRRRLLVVEDEAALCFLVYAILAVGLDAGEVVLTGFKC